MLPFSVEEIIKKDDWLQAIKRWRRISNAMRNKSKAKMVMLYLKTLLHCVMMREMRQKAPSATGWIQMGATGSDGSLRSSRILYHAAISIAVLISAVT